MSLARACDRAARFAHCPVPFANTLHFPVQSRFVTTLHPLKSPFDTSIAFAVVTATEDESILLLPEEEALLSKSASLKRRSEFARGREAAHRAILQLGGAVRSPILKGQNREPLFPEPYIGTISHSDGIAVAAVTLKSSVLSLGIDVQKVSNRFSPELIGQFASESETRWIADGGVLQTQRALIIFSAKESIYKALNPIVKEWFGFSVAEISPEADGTLSARVRPSKINPKLQYSLKVLVSAGSDFVVTGIILPLNTRSNGE